MGGNSRMQKKSSSSHSFSVFNFFKSRRPRKVYEDACDGDSMRRIWPSDEDRGRWVAEPGIDRKASAFIAKFHENRVSESERQFFQSAAAAAAAAANN